MKTKTTRKFATLATTAVLALGGLAVAPAATAAEDYQPIAQFATCVEGQTVHVFSNGNATASGWVRHIPSAGSRGDWHVGTGTWNHWNNTNVRSATASLVAPPNNRATLSLQCHGV